MKNEISRIPVSLENSWIARFSISGAIFPRWRITWYDWVEQEFSGH